MKLFISQPMNGLTDEEIKKGRENAIEEAAEALECSVDDIEVVNSYFDNEAEGKFKPLRMLGEAISLMADADAAYFYDGWSNYRGCMIEFECANQYGIPVVGNSVDDYYLDDDYYGSEDPEWDNDEGYYTEGYCDDPETWGNAIEEEQY